MAFDTYMQIEAGANVVGEATASGIPTGAFEIFSFSLGASNPTTVGTTGSGLSAGKVSVSSFNIMKKTEKSSPKLFTACCTGQHYSTAQVVMRKAIGTAGQQATFLTYTFKDVMVESIQWSGSSGGDDTPTESTSFAFGTIQIDYKTQDTVAGTLATTPVTATWDLTKAHTF
jgi:type VI secretion system secreted protein Hcp